jgi:hypothetical protein
MQGETQRRGLDVILRTQYGDNFSAPRVKPGGANCIRDRCASGVHMELHAAGLLTGMLARLRVLVVVGFGLSITAYWLYPGH